MLDPRVGRWLSIDPKESAWESPYVSMSNNPIMYNDVLGDTVRIKGLKEKKMLKHLQKGLNTTKEENPFMFKDGDLQYDQEKYDNLSKEQKEVADNIVGAIDYAHVITLNIVPNNYSLAKDGNGNDITVWSQGGAATVGPGDAAGNPIDGDVDIFWNGQWYSADGDPMLDVDGNVIKQPDWVILYHELGGHAFLKYVNKDKKQSGKTVDYENKVRSLNEMPIRGYDHHHPDPTPTTAPAPSAPATTSPITPKK